MRDEALVAKQAAVIDQVSNGRLDLGVALGSRHEDYGLYGRTTAGRGVTFERQLERLKELWGAAQATRDTGDAAGPATVQLPHPPLWIGGYAPAAIDRAVTFGDGFLFGAAGVEMMRDRIPLIREAAAAKGRARFPIGGLAYVLPSAEQVDLAEGERLLLRYYGTLRKPFPELVLRGEPEELVPQFEAYRDAGVDVLHCYIVSRDPTMLDRLAREVLPRFAD
jgi:alkanesulfonate monooxygenase SsuD/methylene tetrahydromethanopterin reductase-like flavin-dependent oxidoreductase (luciferase family)